MSKEANEKLQRVIDYEKLCATQILKAFPCNCRECKAYDWGSCPFIYKSDACLIRRNERGLNAKQNS